MSDIPEDGNMNPFEGMNPIERFFLILELRELKRMIDKMKEDMDTRLKENYDDREKKIGDKVKVWDLALCPCIEKESGRKIKMTETYYLENEGMVIEENVEYKFVYDPDEDDNLNEAQKNLLKDMNIEPTVIMLDVLLRYPNGVNLYTCSEFIKRTDLFEK